MKRMLKRLLGTVCLALLLACTIFALDDVYPDTDGVYRYIQEGLAKGNYVLLVTKGLQEAGDKPVISEDTVLYYNVVSPDETGVLSVAFVPTTYTDGTAFLGGGTLDEPLALFHACAGDALDMARIDVTLSTDTVTVTGDEEQFVTYTVKVYDSFGIEQPLPDDAVFSLDNNGGGRLYLNKETSTLEVNGMLAAGVYTLTVEIGDIRGSASLTVHRDLAPATLRYTVLRDGTELDWSYYIFFGTDSVSGVTYDPESLTFVPTAYDRFGDEVDTTFDFSLVTYDEEGLAGNEELCASGVSSYEFVPLQYPGNGKGIFYDIIIRPTGMSSLSETITLLVHGNSEYTGKAQTLFERLLETREYQTALANGDIVVADSGTDVPADKKWVKRSYADELNAVIAETEALLVRVSDETDTVTDAALEAQTEKLRNVTNTFVRALSNGLYSRVTSLGFDELYVYLPVGTRRAIPANVTPTRPSERPVYTSADPSVAAVDQNGTVTAGRTAGETTITVSDIHGTISASYTLVVYVPISGITAPKDTVTVNPGAKIPSPFTFTPASHSDALSYNSSDTRVLTVSKTTGEITVLGAGEATVTVTTRSGKTATADYIAVKPTLSIPDAVVQPGDTLTLALSAASLVSASSVDLTVTFDKETFRFVRADGVASSQSADGIITAKLRVPLAKTVSFTFETLSDASVGDMPFVLQATAADASGNAIPMNVYGCTVTVTDALYGDVNDDGVVNESDLTALGRYFAGYEVVIHEQNADVNADGIVNGADLLRLARHFAGQDVMLGR